MRAVVGISGSEVSKIQNRWIMCMAVVNINLLIKSNWI